MERLHRVVAGTLALGLVAAPCIANDQHVVDRSVLTGAVSAHASQPDSDRDVVRRALQRRDVRDVAEMLGADVDRLTASVDTLEGGDLQRAANAARQVNQQQLVGGATTVVISTTTIIIVLLVVILLVVALK
jgi:hypothetical protein